MTEIPADVTTIGDDDADQATTVEPVTTTRPDMNNRLTPEGNYPKGLRAESARAVTGRRCPHSGEGEDFLSRQPDFFLLVKQQQLQVRVLPKVKHNFQLSSFIQTWHFSLRRDKCDIGNKCYNKRNRHKCDNN